MATLSTRIVIFALVLTTARAHAQAPSDAQRQVDEARRLYAELEFAGAVDAARRALGTPGARDVERASALETMGSALVVLDREEAAREAFESLFRIDPYWAVREPSGSPRIRRFVETVRARMVPDAALDPEIALHLEAPSAARAGSSTRVAIDVEGRPSDRATVRVLARNEGELEWRTIDAERDGERFVASVDVPAGVGSIELYAELRDGRDRVVARAGGPLVPSSVPVRGDAGGSIAEEWWFWALIGGAVIVVGAGVAIGVAASDGGQAPGGTLPPGRVELPLLRF
ncbi:hypothetical protein [Sandaracinus amylolyticus]|uniref:hypothetical protein n=1 Tax=Sandaracinus amylolyticus TaxID=927083 RepID=UPI001F3D78B4|nr:hypothetical protein [Sandaracinus amylolyticus]UJR79050.1 Hypothetical protein I5071_10830 [Sandaracinus amylolyticus]